MKRALLTLLFMTALTPSAVAQMFGSSEGATEIIKALDHIQGSCRKSAETRLVAAAASGMRARAGLVALTPAEAPRDLNAVLDEFRALSALSTPGEQSLARAAIEAMLVEAGGRADDFVAISEVMQAPASVGIEFRSTPPYALLRAFPDGPAGRAGLTVGDRIVSIDGRATAQMETRDFLAALRGPIGSVVTLAVERDGAPRRTVSLTREIVSSQIASQVSWRMQDRVGVITIREFDQSAGQRISEALNELSAKDLRGLVIDVRDNTGGLLDQVIAAADVFLDGGLVLSTRVCGTGEEERYNAQRNEEALGKRLVVLINKGTFSGAELFAAALHDRGRASLVGEATSGFGAIDTAIPLGRRSLIKLKTSDAHTASGAKLDGVGVKPDVAVVQTTSEPDLQLERAIRLLSE